MAQLYVEDCAYDGSPIFDIYVKDLKDLCKDANIDDLLGAFEDLSLDSNKICSLWALCSNVHHIVKATDVEIFKNKLTELKESNSNNEEVRACFNETLNLLCF